MSKPARWSLSSRFLRGLFLGLTGVVTVSVGVSAWYLLRSTERELTALLLEELDEIEADAPGDPDTPAAWKELVRELRAHHPGQPLALTVWAPEAAATGGAPLAAWGSPELVAAADPLPAPLEETVHSTDRTRWMSRRLASGHVVGIAIDGEPQFALLRSFGRSAALLIALASLLALAGGVLFCRRTTGLLHAVADRARSAHNPDQPLDPDLPGAPEEIRELVEALAEMQTNARREAEATKLLVAGLAHELRSPLQLMLGSTEVALLGPDLPDDVRELLERQLDDLHDFGDTVHNLVSLCRPGGSSADGPIEHFDLGEEVELRLAREHELAARRDVRLVVERSGPQGLNLAGDREALLRAVRNLAANGVQWTEPGGTVHVELSGHAETVEVRVDDQGPGVPGELREEIFEPFVRGPTSTGRRAGYGLGLALARMAAEQQGGTLRVGDSPSGGARFEMVLPRRPHSPAV